MRRKARARGQPGRRRAGTLLFRVTGVPNGHDETRPEHYTADPDGPAPGQAAGGPGSRPPPESTPAHRASGRARRTRPGGTAALPGM